MMQSNDLRFSFGRRGRAVWKSYWGAAGRTPCSPPDLVELVLRETGQLPLRARPAEESPASFREDEAEFREEVQNGGM